MHVRMYLITYKKVREIEVCDVYYNFLAQFIGKRKEKGDLQNLFLNSFVLPT